MKRHIPRTLVLIATIMLLFLYPLIAPPAHRIDEAHLALIYPGMTEADVQGIFGVPPGAYNWSVGDERSIWIETGAYQWSGRAALQTDGHIVTMLDADDVTFLPKWKPSNTRYSRTWISRHGVFFVTFDTRGRVTHTGTLGPSRREPPWTRWWRQWLSR
jgi:hypothetical protein